MSSTPDSPAKMPDDRTTQGGNYWTLFTPGIWKLLHAVLQLSASDEAAALRRRWYSVSNGDFGRYRRKAGKGHDYVNVSDVRVVRLPMPVNVTF
jgi:hypothetical protein